MDIYFLRHASAGDSTLNPAKDDERALDKLGIEQSHNVGCALAAMKVAFDAILSSPLRAPSKLQRLWQRRSGIRTRS